MISRRALAVRLAASAWRRRRARRIFRADRSASSCRSRPAARPTCSAACSRPACRPLWGQTVISEYRPGAAGVIGTRQVIAAPADGHTLLMASTGAILALAGGQSGAFDVTRELAPVSLIAAPPYILVVNPTVPVRNAAELIALRQGQSRQAVVRLVRRRLGVASVRRAVRADGRHRDAACAVSRHRARP